MGGVTYTRGKKYIYVSLHPFPSLHEKRVDECLVQLEEKEEEEEKA